MKYEKLIYMWMSINIEVYLDIVKVLILQTLFNLYFYN